MTIQEIIYIIPPMIMIIGYIPSLIDLIIYKKKTVNYFSYSLWAIANATMFYYSFIILPDLYFQVISSINCLACIAVVCLDFLIKDTLVTEN